MDEKTKAAYRHLLYVAMIAIRNDFSLAAERAQIRSSGIGSIGAVE